MTIAIAMFPRRNHPFTYQGGHFTPRPLVPREEGAFQSACDRYEERMKRDRFNFRAFDPTGCDKLPRVIRPHICVASRLTRARNTTAHLNGVTLDVERNTWDFRFHCELEVRHLIAKKRHQFFAAIGEYFARLQANNILRPDSNLESCDLPWVGFPNELAVAKFYTSKDFETWYKTRWPDLYLQENGGPSVNRTLLYFRNELVQFDKIPGNCVT